MSRPVFYECVMKKFYALFFSLLCLLFLAGCSTQKQDPPVEGVVRVCSSMNRNLSEVLVEDFANKTGIVVEFDPLVSTTLSQRLDLLGNSKVDVWMGGSAEEYYMAAERDMLATYLPRGSANIPPQYMDRDGRWVPLSIDYIALLSNRNNMQKLGIEYKDCHGVGTIVHVAIDNAYAGHILISDIIKPAILF